MPPHVLPDLKRNVHPRPGAPAAVAAAAPRGVLAAPGPGPRVLRSALGARACRTPARPHSSSCCFNHLDGFLRKRLSGTAGELNKNPVEGFSAGLIDDNDLYRWEVLIIGPPDTLYEGGVFKAHLTFPKDYPLRPPKMKFITEIWHPNVDKNGDVCISILHEPGEDKYGYEKPEERWLPIHTVETIMISVISMLADPNGDSPANVDAAKEWREDRNGEFKRKVARCVRKSQETAFE
ncbi:ubiquitin-conjugating enzyme E2 G1 isoform X1 [Canis aureus]